MGVPPDSLLLLVGAMKCGTSTLFRYLASHPAIAPSRYKEPEYFSEFQGHKKSVTRYDQLWDFRLGEHHYALEASTGYTKYPDEPHVPVRIAEAGLEPRIIYSVRDPIRRMESQFNHGLIASGWGYRDFNAPQLLNYSRYYMQMQQFLACFPDRSRYFIVDFDELVRSPQKTLDRILAWLGLETIPVTAPVHANRTPPTSRVDRWAQSDVGGRVAGLLPRPVRIGLKAGLRTIVPAHSQMNEPDRKRFRTYIRRDMQLFGQTFGFPVQKWGFATTADRGGA